MFVVLTTEASHSTICMSEVLFTADSSSLRQSLRHRYNVLHCFYLLLVAQQPMVEPATYSSGALASRTFGGRKVDG